MLKKSIFNVFIAISAKTLRKPLKQSHAKFK